MFEGILSLEKDALEKLTNERRVSGSVPQELSDTLFAIGVISCDHDSRHLFSSWT